MTDVILSIYLSNQSIYLSIYVLPGLYFSTVSNPLFPSNPPTAYSSPCNTATPRVLRLDSMGSTGTHRSSSISNRSTDLRTNEIDT